MPKINQSEKTLKMRFFAKNNAKFYYLLLPIFIASSILPNSVSAVSYQTEITPTFTVNDTLSITVSSADLLIDNLVPGGDGGDSNTITITVNTNNEWGYVLSSTVGNTTYNNTNLTGVSSVFTNLSSEVDTLNAIPNNYWGYSFSIDNGSTWSNYNGLPLYTDETNTAILNESDARTANATTQFKIGAKAGSDQLSGTYQNVINFAVTNKARPVVTMEDAFDVAGKSKTTYGYYAMQDMTPAICAASPSGSSAQLVDTRGDNNVYWVTKLSDDHCWMTQNLDLNLSTETALTSENTDLNVYDSNGYKLDTAENDSYGYSYDSNTGVISWTPSTTTLDMTSAAKYNAVSSWSTTWGSNNTTYNQETPQSMDVGVKYQKGTYFSSSTCNYITSTTCTNFSDTPDTEGGNGEHGAIGNYYNWTAAIAANNSSSWTSSTYSNIANNPQNSICPKGWRLPTVSSVEANNEFSVLNTNYNSDHTDIDVDAGLFGAPLYFTRAGYVNSSGLYNAGNYGYYWSSTVNSGTYAYLLYFRSTSVSPALNGYRFVGGSVRCVAREASQ